MPIPNLLTKLIVNINRLPYEKQEELFLLSEEWLQSNKTTSLTAATKRSVHFEKTDAVPSSSPPQFPSQPPSTFGEKETDPEVTLFEERAHERKELSVPIEFVESGSLYKEITQDISAGGVFIKTQKQKKFREGQRISMVFLLDDSQKPYKLSGTIVRVEKKGVAVKFDNISAIECVAIEEELSSLDGDAAT